MQSSAQPEIGVSQSGDQASGSTLTPVDAFLIYLLREAWESSEQPEWLVKRENGKNAGDWVLIEEFLQAAKAQVTKVEAPEADAWIQQLTKDTLCKQLNRLAGISGGPALLQCVMKKKNQVHTTEFRNDGGKCWAALELKPTELGLHESTCPLAAGPSMRPSKKQRIDPAPPEMVAIDSTKRAVVMNPLLCLLAVAGSQERQGAHTPCRCELTA